MPRNKSKKVDKEDKLVSFKFSLSYKKDAEVIGFLNGKSKFDRGEWIAQAVRLKYKIHTIDITVPEEKLEEFILKCLKEYIKQHKNCTDFLK